MDRANGLGVAAGADVVVAGHRHGAESYAGDVESADRDVLHGDFVQSITMVVSRIAQDRLPDSPRLLPEMTIRARSATIASVGRVLRFVRRRTGGIPHEASDLARTSFERLSAPRLARHRALCPTRRRPRHRHSGAHAPPPQCAYRAPALRLQPGPRRHRAGRQAGAARGRGDRLRPWAIHADHHRLCLVVSHVTRASLREPFLGLMLTLDARSHHADWLPRWICASAPARRRAYRSISVRSAGRGLGRCARSGWSKLLDEPTLVPSLAPLIQQEITIRLLTGPHGAQLRHLVAAGSPSQQIAKAVAWLKRNFAETLQVDELGCSRAHEPIDLPAAFPRHHRR